MAVKQCFSKHNCSIPNLPSLNEEGEDRFVRWMLANATVWLEISYEDGIECMRQSRTFTRNVLNKCMQEKHPGYELPKIGQPVHIGYFVGKMKDLGSSFALWPIAFDSLKAVYHSNACSAVPTSKLNLDKCINTAFELNIVNPYKAFKLQEATFRRLCGIHRSCLIMLGENCTETMQTAMQQSCNCGYEKIDEIALTLEERFEQCYDITMRSDVLREKSVFVTDCFLYMAGLSDWFWNEDVWLPPGTGWENLENSGIGHLPDFCDLVLPVYYAFVFLAVRAAFEWSLARPLGHAFGIRDSRSSLPHFFHCIAHRFQSLLITKRRCFNSHPVVNGFVQSGNPGKQNRRRSDSMSQILHMIHQKSLLDKFSESCWRFVYYLFIFIYGLVVLWDKPWFWDTSYCWYGYPYQPVDDEIRWYYIIELSFYWSLMFSQFVDVVRKDFWVNFVHHVTTILLLSFSWVDNFVRIGSLVLIVHDAADFWMEGAKMARYCKKVTLCNVLFVIFTAVWFVTRCGLYPFKIIYSTTLEAPALVEFFGAYYIFNALLLILLVLQLFWSGLILKIALNAVRSGETDDVRSDAEDSESADASNIEVMSLKNRSKVAYSLGAYDVDVSDTACQRPFILTKEVSSKQPYPVNVYRTGNPENPHDAVSSVRQWPSRKDEPHPGNMLSKSVDENHRKWDIVLPKVMVAYRASVQSSNRTAPYTMVFGEQCRLPEDIYRPVEGKVLSQEEHATQLKKVLDKMHIVARRRLRAVRKLQKHQYDKSSRGRSFRKGSLVSLRSPRVARREKCRKLTWPWVGPHQMLAKPSAVTYQIQHVRNRNGRQIVHFDRLKSCPKNVRIPTHQERVHMHPTVVIPRGMQQAIEFRPTVVLEPDEQPRKTKALEQGHIAARRPTHEIQLPSRYRNYIVDLPGHSHV
uniref:TLC domain-containing protein n=2 Tax=Trichuris muris TaxID=70415 RepID=A0A5S6QM27_TRIMR